jgi:3-deoxy-D-manno-octulosonate 8-phosphate phosphatase (KDO 8-P phosphatase)
LSTVAAIFKKNGGRFLTPPESLERKVKKLGGFIFDWDGVFNDSGKRADNESYFTEVDSMGMNMLRFSNWILNKKHLAPFAVMSGEDNYSAKFFATREHFNSIYFKAKNKKVALEDFCHKANLKFSEIGFVFDDILDLSISERAGVRIFIPRKANPLLTEYVIKNKLADYITSCESGNFALREAQELLIGLAGNYDKVLNERIAHSKLYEEYLKARQLVETHYYVLKGNVITAGSK